MIQWQLCLLYHLSFSHKHFPRIHIRVGEGRSITRLTVLLGYACVSGELNIVHQRIIKHVQLVGEH